MLGLVCRQSGIELFGQLWGLMDIMINDRMKQHTHCGRQRPREWLARRLPERNCIGYQQRRCMDLDFPPLSIEPNRE